MRVDDSGNDQLVSEWTNTDTVERPSVITNYENTLANTTDWENDYDNANSQPDILTDLIIKLSAGFNNIKWLKKKADSADQRLTTLDNQVASILNMIYPVGSLYWSRTNVNPSTLFGGTWVQIKDKFILAAGDTYAIDTRGGAATHSVTFTGTTDPHELTWEEMPEHYHGMDELTGQALPGLSAHTHSYKIPALNETDTPIGEGGLFSNPREEFNWEETGDGLQVPEGQHGHDVVLDPNQQTHIAGRSQAHTHTLSATAGGSVETMPPYDVFYCWERVADPV